MIQCGIYLITHTESGLRYVGQSRNIASRFRSHSKGNTNSRIGLAVLKHGWSSFKPEVIEICPLEKLNSAEIQWIKFYDCISPKGYNLMAGGSLIGSHHPETCAKISAALKGRKARPEELQKRLVWLQSGGMSQESREKMSAARTGAKQSPDAIAKTAAFNTGKRRTPETIAKVAAALTGLKRSPEQRYALSTALTGRKLSPEHIANRSKAVTGTKRSVETKARISAAVQAANLRKLAVLDSGSGNLFP